MLTVYIDELDLTILEYYRAALSEDTFDGRKKAISDLAKQVKLWELKGLMKNDEWKKEMLEEKPENLLQMALDIAEWSDGAVAFTHVISRFDNGQNRKLRIADQIGLEIWRSIKAGKFRGVHTVIGVLNTVRHKTQKLKFNGGRDKNGLREKWNTYRGVVHFGIARAFCKERGLDNHALLEVAEGIRRQLSSNCPKGTSKPYVDEGEKISFVYKSST
ncbi:hypothetical protein FHS72_002993 [Loktanella ponticola]|uniref:Uncharacterized protein n=1 Tax=Yoonia ponticola TaxID=1524255 RepID=A0A7W9EYZ9_9RHOB|nr:hypothetical protein [Yoonia ponticola]MBB5723353.1 hypothetical protein [Yoonia ponticola]